ncbi:hypothetical protein TRSC58_03418 [Trypanosoma rangeli SC58]|uniref:Uncharacterized protein n=1 Tax=Trypanosoma rangeli SC58 TaxID=429131 RepID=A0A061J3Z6_TRYRA|nr:hypothetical protein TRSC58_03418 [Trypanosoma rangeli SC58]
MPMFPPMFTTDPQRIARLQENYDAGVEREKIPVSLREKLDLEQLTVSAAKLKFLFQNSMESYGPAMKNKKVVDYNLKDAPMKGGKWMGLF